MYIGNVCSLQDKKRTVSKLETLACFYLTKTSGYGFLRSITRLNRLSASSLRCSWKQALLQYALSQRTQAGRRLNRLPQCAQVYHLAPPVYLPHRARE